MDQPGSYFLKMIQTLRWHEEIMLYANVPESDADSNEVISFLKDEYSQESIAYPFQIPDYNSNASLWAAKIVYVAAQLILYRKNKESDLTILLPEYLYEIDESAMLSADLCLRFLPDMINQLKMIDSEDALINVLENILIKWHYSGTNFPLDAQKLDFAMITPNTCLHQLYINRIIENKNVALADHMLWSEHIKAQFGIYSQSFWKEFKGTTISHG
jgi:hypothetical protein